MSALQCVATDLAAHGYALCPRSPHFRCYFCQLPICRTHGRRDKKPDRGYHVRACPDCKKLYAPPAPEIRA